jgi:putative ABC transport system permease protein
MNDFFGIPMSTVAIVLAVATLIVFAILAIAAFRNPVMFKFGIRNVPRRKAQTILIVFGLMLSTLIITAAFGTGDTLSYSITNSTYQAMGHIDLVVNYESDEIAQQEQQTFIPQDFAEQFRADWEGDERIDGIGFGVRETMPAINVRTNLSEPNVIVYGFEPDRLEAFGGLTGREGQEVTIEDLGPSDIIINEDAADELEAEEGDTVRFFFQNQPLELTVVAIVDSQVAFDGGNLAPGALLPFDRAQDLFGRPGEVDDILISATGGLRGEPLELADELADDIAAYLDALPLQLYEVNALKKDFVDIAETVGAVFTTVFIVFGLFSVFSGILLIFLIFIMLAAERRSEMGMARAVGTKRGQLVESFLAEGMAYDLGSAAVGLVLGIAVAFSMVKFVSYVLGDTLGIDMPFHITPTSMVASFCLGVLVTFLTVTLASWRASRLNIVAAIRDVPEDSTAFPAGVTKGRVLIRALYEPLFIMFDWFIKAPFRLLRWLLRVPLRLGRALLTAVGILKPRDFKAVRQGRPRRDPAAEATQRASRRLWWWVAAILLGVYMTLQGYAVESQFLFTFGVSIVILGGMMLARFFGAPPRITFTTAGLVLLAVWILGSRRVTDDIIGKELSGDIEMFFLSGVMMVTAATLVIMYNADLVLGLMNRLSERMGSFAPAVKTAVAYPLASKFRTGATIAMISLITFSLVVFATINSNYDAVFLSDRAAGGWDVIAIPNENNNIEDFNVTAGQAGIDTSQFSSVGRLAFPSRLNSKVQTVDPALMDVDLDPEDNGFATYPVFGADEEFLSNTDQQLTELAAGYESAEEVFQAMIDDPTLAVIHGSATTEGGAFTFVIGELLHLEPVEDGFEPIPVIVRNTEGGEPVELTIIGVVSEVDQVLSLPNVGLTAGLLTNQEGLGGLFENSQGLVNEFLIQLEEGVSSRAVANEIESSLIEFGVQSESFDERLSDQQRQSQGFLLLFQGFMGLGLLVGIAALGVISFRAVVERRQQIGMLRAIGYKRSMVSWSMLIESSIIALTGILSGVILGCILALNLFAADSEFQLPGHTFFIPWTQVVLLIVISYGAALLMTWVPSRMAGRIPIAEALRYE